MKQIKDFVKEGTIEAFEGEIFIKESTKLSYEISRGQAKESFIVKGDKYIHIPTVEATKEPRAQKIKMSKSGREFLNVYGHKFYI